jgi:hypothetical protein
MRQLEADVLTQWGSDGLLGRPNRAERQWVISDLVIDGPIVHAASTDVHYEGRARPGK